jgi:serine O-acetyltransferase
MGTMTMDRWDTASAGLRSTDQRSADGRHADERSTDQRSADELSLVELVTEDFRTHGNKVASPGFWAVATHRFGARIEQAPPLARAPLEALHRVVSTAVDWVWGIHLPRATRLGRRVHIWHFGSTVLNARSIGNDVHIRHDTTVGPVRSADAGRRDALPVIEDAVDLGAGACVMGDVTVGRGAVVLANTVVLEAVPAGVRVFGVPGRIIPG